MRFVGKVVKVKIMSLFLFLSDIVLTDICLHALYYVHVSLEANSQLIVETTPINACDKILVTRFQPL